jgi:16S rRNA (adenine1518-N6/adenine1519-N6)-dimethyltransferase
VIRARKRFGQHFLEPVWVDKLIRAIDPQPDQTFIEIGPGRGALTRPRAGRAKAVFAHEIDRDLASELRDAAIPNVTVVEGDFLETSSSVLRSPLTNPPNPQSPIPNHCLRVAGNLPYNVASPIMFKLVDAYLEGAPLVDATLMLQLEVAERLVAPAGTKTYGVLSILIRHCANVDLLLKLPPGAFRPPPKVRSAVVRLDFHPPDPRPRSANIRAAGQDRLHPSPQDSGERPTGLGTDPGQSLTLSPGLSRRPVSGGLRHDRWGVRGSPMFLVAVSLSCAITYTSSRLINAGAPSSLMELRFAVPSTGSHPLPECVRRRCVSRQPNARSRCR